MARFAMAEHKETDYIVIDVANNSSTVLAEPGMLFGLYVNTVLSAHVNVFKDGGITGTPVVSTLVSLAAGTCIYYPGIRFNTDITFDPADAATGNITVFYRKMNNTGAT